MAGAKRRKEETWQSAWGKPLMRVMHACTHDMRRQQPL
jgi:hypothetical protein